jgi:hypothetical protein
MRACWYLMYICRRFPGGWWCRWRFWPAAFLVRVFIIFHDCGHGSFFKSRGANDAVGFLSGILTFTPYYHWRWEHAIHHSSAGDLDKRGTGDVWTMTVQEYLESSRWKKFAYRLARNPSFVCHRADVFVRDPAAVSRRQSQPARTPFRLCHERWPFWPWPWVELDFRLQGLFDHPVDHPDGRRRRGRVDVLRPAPV